MPKPKNTLRPAGYRSLHEQLKTSAKAAVRNLHSDMSVGNLVTRDDLIELRDYINELVDAIDNDVERSG